MSDAATWLSYIQQRYYDPGIGRFLSVDPVTADGNTGGNFNRYWYANNNPYRFTDPDGRCIDGVTCSAQFKSHVEWRMSHPGAPADALEKVAFVGAGIMGGVTVGPTVYASRTTIAMFMAMSGQPVEAIQGLEAFLESRVVVIKIAEQSKRVGEIARKIEKLLAAIIVIPPQSESPSEQDSQKPPPDTTEHRPRASKAKPPPEREELVHEIGV